MNLNMPHSMFYLSSCKYNETMLLFSFIELPLLAGLQPTHSLLQWSSEEHKTVIKDTLKLGLLGTYFILPGPCGLQFDESGDLLWPSRALVYYSLLDYKYSVTPPPPPAALTVHGEVIVSWWVCWWHHYDSLWFSAYRLSPTYNMDEDSS